MKLKVMGLLFICTMWSFSVAAENQYTRQLLASDIEMLYIHTDKQSIISIQQLAILQVKTGTTLPPTGPGGVCDGGLWLNSKDNPSTYSMLLAAILAKKTIDVYYSDEPTPWGNIQYCSLWRVGIK